MRDKVLGGALPIYVELVGGGIQEGEAGAVGRLLAALEQRRVQCAAEPVGGQVVDAAVAHDCRRCDRLEDPQHHRPDTLHGRAPAPGRDWVCGPACSGVTLARRLVTRGGEAIEAVKDLTNGVGAGAVMECVGTGQAMLTAISIARPGSMVGDVGVPHGVELPIGDMFFRNVGVRGGSAPVRAYIAQLLPDVLEGRVNPGRVFDFATDLDGVAEAYAAMDERRVIKSLLRVGTV